MAPIDLKQLEIDRILNVVRPLGWTVVSTKREGDKVEVILEKIVKGEV